MTTEVKICGLKTEADTNVALEYGADYIGLVFFEPSPRNVSIADGKRLAKHVAGQAKIVALTVNASDAFVESIADAINPDICQLHGDEDITRIGQIAALAGCKTMKAIKVASSQDAEQALIFKDVADYILFDAKAPKGSVLPGGNGLQFDWQALETIKSKTDFTLSGGLTPENVQEAIRLTGAGAVDVSSGVETASGQKDPARIRAFLRAAKDL